MAKSGFYSTGKSHKEGGIDVLVDGVKPIEVEQFEYKLCKNAMQSEKIFEFKNKNNKEILDTIFEYANCEFKQHEANSVDFILCKLTVLNPKKRNITGTCKEIVNIMQSEKSCNISNYSDEFKGGGEIKNKWKAVEKMSKSEAKEFYNTKEGKALDKETYTKWKSLVNMSKSELQNFYESKEGKEAGLSASETKEKGIDSGRESARWILKMLDIPYTKWTPNMWRWAKKQISFISRMSGMKGDLYDDKGSKTRKHTSLLIWGHNPEKYNNGGEIKTNEMENKETLIGGKADKLTIEDIANKHKVSIEYAKEQLSKGMKIESEHTKDTEKQKEIALDHLSEFIDYYKELDKMEEKLNAEKMNAEFDTENKGKYYINKTGEVVRSEINDLKDFMEDKLKEEETGKTINSYSVKNWDEVPQVWKNTNEIKKVNFVNSPYNKELIKIVTPFTGTDALRPIMSGVHFDENGITCTDAHKLITLPYPNKDFNGTYATVSKKYLADAEIKKDLFTVKKYPNYEAVIPKASDAIRVHEISIYKILQYTNVAQNYVNKSSHQAVYSLGDTSIGFNIKFLTDILETALKLGHKKIYAFTKNPNNAVVFSTSKNYSVGKDEIFLLMPTIVYTSNDDVVVNGAFELDFSRELLVYYDFSKDAIVNQDGTIAEFKMNYGDYDVIKSSDIKMLKDFGGKNPAIVLLENFKVDNGKIYAASYESGENYLTIKNIDLKDGIYNLLNNAIEYNPNEAISGFDEFPNPKTDLGETKLKFIINSEVFTHYIKTAVDFTGNDDIRPVMMGILLDYNNNQLFLVSTNAHIMFKKNITEYCEINKDIADFQVILPKINLLKFLDNIDESPLVVTCTPNYIKFENDGYEFITRKIDGRYPAYNGVIPTYKSKKLNINIKDLFICINSDEAKSFIKENAKTDISIYDKPTKNNELDIYLGITNRSELKIEKEVKICTVNYTKEEGNFQMKDSVYLIMPMILPIDCNFVFNIKYFREILEVCNTETLELYYDEKNRAYIIQGDALSYSKTINSKKKESAKPVKVGTFESITEIDNDAANSFNEIYKEWNKIKTKNQWDKWAEKVRLLKYGTYQNKNILDMFENYDLKYPNEVIKRDFLVELHKALKLKVPENLKTKTEIKTEPIDETFIPEVKEQSNEQTELKEAIDTFEMLVSLGGSKKELKEWNEAIETFKMLLDSDVENSEYDKAFDKMHKEVINSDKSIKEQNKLIDNWVKENAPKYGVEQFSKGGDITTDKHEDIEKKIMEEQFGKFL
jgi:DNA polymerase III sliding clamp (beta) subunit (PCNA family)